MELYIPSAVKFINNSTFIIDRFHIYQAVEKVVTKTDNYSKYVKIKIKLAIKNTDITNLFKYIKVYAMQLKYPGEIKRIEQLWSYFSNNKTAIELQNHPYFIGCRIEAYIYHYICLFIKISKLFIY